MMPTSKARSLFLIPQMTPHQSSSVAEVEAGQSCQSCQSCFSMFWIKLMLESCGLSELQRRERVGHESTKTMNERIVRRLLIVGLLGFGGLPGLGTIASGQVTHRLGIAILRGVPITDLEVQEILRETGYLLRMGDSPEDVRALVTFDAADRVRRSNYLGDVYDGTYLKRILTGAQGYLIIVNNIWFCGDAKGPGRIMGCTPVGARQGSVVAYRPNRSRRFNSVIWAHEYAHSKGSVDLNGFKTCPGRLAGVMEGVACEGNRVITMDDCRRIVAPHVDGATISTSGHAGGACVAP